MTTTTDFKTRPADEARTHELIETWRAAHEWNHEFQVVAPVFKAMWQAALPVDRIEAIAKAIHGLSIEDGQLKPILTKLCRDKVLRSRVHFGKRLYEVNF
ncbi:MAG TPA: hypothetical protein VGG68_00810 [Caulobacteraceae bacterium]|jgi:hypothetical protein